MVNEGAESFEGWWVGLGWGWIFFYVALVILVVMGMGMEWGSRGEYLGWEDECEGEGLGFGVDG